MPTREEKIAFIQSQMDKPAETREQKIAFLMAKNAGANAQAAPQDDPSMLQSIGHGIAAAGRFVDSYTGAPARAAVGAAQDGNNPISAFANQFGGDPSKAPTGYDIASKVTDNPYLGTALATAVDFGADPLNALPAVGVAKKLAFGAKALEGASDVAKAVKPGLIDTISSKLKTVAEKAAVNATGATGKQAAEFAPSAGRELLDRGIVKLGDNQAKIAARAGEAVTQANSEIDTALSALDEKGVKVDANNVYKVIRDKITQMRTDPSKADVAKLMENELDNLVKSTEAKGSAEFGMQEAENVKRGYNRKAGNWADPEKSMSGKELYQTWRGAVEDAAKAADPQTAKAFEEGKKSYSLLAPIQEAAERRAATTAQSPAGGLLDAATAGAGFVKGGPVGMVAAPLARRFIAPRLASTIAVSADKAADLVKLAPQAVDAMKTPATIAEIASRGAGEKLNSLAKVADQPTKGPDKWANDGFDKLLNHMSPEDADMLSKNKSTLLGDKETKELLFKASDLEPGSKAMEAVLSKIKTKLAKGDE